MAITNNYIGVMAKIYLIRHCKSEGGACSRAQVQTKSGDAVCYGTAEDIANAVLFYASDLSDYMNVNGGLYM